MKPKALAIWLAALWTVAACDGRNPATPDGVPAPTSGPAPGGGAATLSVTIRGQVIDGERGTPVANAGVRIDSVHANGDQWALNPARATVASDAAGAFTLVSQLPSGWHDLLLAVTAEGHEPTHVYVESVSETAVLRMYRVLAVRPGEAVETDVRLSNYVCGWESVLCRRVVVDAGGATVDLELVPLDGQMDVGVFTGDPGTAPYDFKRRLTVQSGEVWIFGDRGRVRLSARRM